MRRFTSVDEENLPVYRGRAISGRFSSRGSRARSAPPYGLQSASATLPPATA
jgi:hypothetical protein